MKICCFTFKTSCTDLYLVVEIVIGVAQPVCALQWGLDGDMKLLQNSDGTPEQSVVGLGNVLARGPTPSCH